MVVSRLVFLPLITCRPKTSEIGKTYSGVFKKAKTFRKFLNQYYSNGWSRIIHAFTSHQLVRSQIYDGLKNASCHGGDASVFFRETNNFLVVTIHDCGPGISDIRDALNTPEYDSYSGYCGRGRGLDDQIADVVIIVSRGKRVVRRKQNGDYSFERIPVSLRGIQGTKVTYIFSKSRFQIS